MNSTRDNGQVISKPTLLGRLRAPRANGALLAVPPLSEWQALARDNVVQFAASRFHISGGDLQEYRSRTRATVLEAAREYLQSVDAPADVMERLKIDADGPLFVTGHQPVLAHPGVWAKNVATAALARQACGAGLNLIVDNDSALRTSIDLPAGTRDEPRYQSIAFDLPAAQQPWEELPLRSAEELQAFSWRVAEALRDWQIEPELTEVWPGVVSHAGDSANIAELLTRARLAMEWRRGLGNFELPVSRLAQLPPFLGFMAHIALRGEEFLSTHNAALAEYRQQYRLHSVRHPVPDLERREGWVELPYWLWRAGEQRRQRLFVQQTAEWISLGNEAGPISSLSLTADQAANESLLADHFAELQQSWKIRPRALSLTLFARVALADLFIHGIGGAKYDEVTDRIIARFFPLTPPAYSVLTATLHLPLPAFESTADDVLRLERMLRDMEYNPHLFVNGAEATSLVAERDQLVADRARDRDRLDEEKTDDIVRQSNRQRHRRLKEIREQLAGLIANQRRDAESKLARARSETAANRVLRNREFATVLFPARQLDGLVEPIDRQITGPSP